MKMPMFPTRSQLMKRATKRMLLGFTLIELLVSLAVISLALAAVGVVFTSTTDAAGAATALQEYDAWLRQFTDELKADLEGIDPTKHALVIVGRTQEAALTEQDRNAQRRFRMQVGYVDPGASFDPETDNNVNPANDGYSDPRADILMIITDREMVSQTPPTDTSQAAAARFSDGDEHSPVAVVYGHASFDVANADADDFEDSFLHISQNGSDSDLEEISPVPATDWVLARRATLLSEEPLNGSDNLALIDNGDRILRMWFDSADDDLGADVDGFSWTQFLRDLRSDALNSDPGCGLESPYLSNWGGDCDNLRTGLINELLYAGSSNDEEYHIATVLRDPPLLLRSNLGLQAVPHCVWFQVEFLMPEDARNHVDYQSLNEVDPGNDYARYQDSGGTQYHTRFDMPLWTSIDPSGTGSGTNTNFFVFLPNTPEALQTIRLDALEPSPVRTFSDIDQSDSGTTIRPRMFPYGLRITVRVVDPQDRLAEPLERVIVHYFD